MVFEVQYYVDTRARLDAYGKEKILLSLPGIVTLSTSM
jgi:hypothetical protein